MARSEIISDLICQIRGFSKSVLSDFQTTRSGLKKRGAAKLKKNSDKTLCFQVFDIAPQTIDNNLKKFKATITKPNLTLSK